jgi:GTPase SAR1 family protein
MFQSLISQIYSDENIPTVTVEMALSRRYNLSTVAEFSLIDTPGPDEARQSSFLDLRLREVLQQANAVICVTTANSMQNTAEDNVCKMVQQLDRFNVFDKSLLVFVNHADKSDSPKKELEVRRSTAQAFFKDPARSDCVFFTSALNGFCAVKMEKLLLSLGAAQASPGELLKHLKGEDPETEDWIAHWINFSYGFDGIPSAKGWPTFSAILEKNMMRWRQSRLEGPVTLIFDFWAGKVGCMNLRSAVAELLPSMEKTFRACEDVLSAYATKDSDINKRISNCKAKIKVCRFLLLQNRDAHDV